jgi:hypothetical protein
MSDIEYVPDYDADGNDLGGYTETVPDMPVKEEPDCHACNDSGCPACEPTTAELRTLERPVLPSGDFPLSLEPPF